MKLTRSIAYLLAPVLLGSALVGFGRINTSLSPTSPVIPAAANASNPAPASDTPAAPVSPSVAQSTGGTRDLGPIEFAPGSTTASIDNFIDPSGIDRYTFDASAGQPATVNISSQTGQVLLTLVAPDGTPLVRSQSGRTSWSGNLPMDGTYTVDAVNQYSGAQYSVNLNIQPVSGGGGAQINNQGAIQFAPGRIYTSVNGYLNPKNTDRYTFDASAGQSVNLRINSPRGQVMLTLIDPNGNPLVRYQSGANSWSGTLPAGGTYQVDVLNQSGASSYNLGLRITS